jgi:hypothetical protein
MQNITRTKVRIASTLLLILLPGLVYAHPVDVRGQECIPPEIREAVRNAAKVRSERIPLTVTELTTMNERVIALEQENHGEKAKLQVVRFYEVRPATYELADGALISVTVQLDGESIWVVGLGPNKVLYKLAGFANSVSDFNRLMRDLSIHVNGPEDALSVFDIFARIAQPREFFGSLVGDAMQLQSVALQDFRLRYPESTRGAAYDKWWKAMPLHTRKNIAPPKVESRQSDFEVIYYRYREGVVKRESVLIDAEGAARPRQSLARITKIERLENRILAHAL